MIGHQAGGHLRKVVHLPEISAAVPAPGIALSAPPVGGAARRVAGRVAYAGLAIRGQVS